MIHFLVSILLFTLMSAPVADLPKDSFVLPENEQLGQLFIVGFYGTTVTPEFAAELREFRPGGVLLLGRNIESATQLKKLNSDLQAIATEDNRPPLWIAVDQEGGIVSRIKWTRVPEAPSALSAMNALPIGERRGEELRALGINMNLAPVLDSRNPSDFLANRAFPSTDQQAELIARGLIEGHWNAHVLAVPKHFPGYDGIKKNPEMTVIPKVAHTPPTGLFRSIVRKVPIVMAAHVIYENLDPEIPFPLSQIGIALFKIEFGDDTLLMSDDLLSPAMQKWDHVPHLAQQSVESGLDIFLLGDPKQARYFMLAFKDRASTHPELAPRFAKTAQRILELKGQH
ncbi:glycoside hydrolase family 3 protein [Candidatus Uhrbacteria bacterium]|nr:glycoside hydrolase family 3 protein [Candidatus Uhrbacteria bacterium]